MTAEIQRGRKYPEFRERKTRFEEFHQKLVERAISVIKPLKVLERVNDEFLKSRGKVTKESFQCLENFNLGWTDCHIEADYYRRHQITIAFCPFLVGSNQVIKNVDQLLHNDTPKGTVYPGFVVLGGSEAKAIRNDWENIGETKNISSLNPDVSTIFQIPTRLGKINKANLIKGVEASFNQALQKAFLNSALKE
jgi:hypothetical protein